MREEEQEGGQSDHSGFDPGLMIPLLVIFKDFSLNSFNFSDSCVDADVGR